MRPFRFFNKVLVKSQGGNDIFYDETFYTVNKIPLARLRGDGFIPKYSIVRRKVSLQFRNKFIPDHDVLWYFKDKISAMYWIQHQMAKDKHGQDETI